MYYIIKVTFLLATAAANLSSSCYDNILLGLIEIPVQMEIIVVSSLNSCSDSKFWNLNNSQSICGFKEYNHSVVNSGPMIVMFLCTDKLEFEVAVSKVLEFLAKNKRGRNWKPIFILQYPEKLNRKENFSRSNRMDPLILLLIENGVVDSPVYILYHDNNNSTKFNLILLVEVYSIRNQSILREINLTNNTQDNFNQIEFITSRRSNFEKAMVIAVAMDDPDYPLATEFKGNNTTELVGGFEVFIFQYFRDALNFSESAIRGTDYIYAGSNGTLIGHVIQVNNGDGDVGIGAAEFLEYRVKGPDALTYIHPTFHARVFAFFKQPSASSFRNIFVQTFTTELWFASVLIWTLIFIFIKGFVRLKRKHDENHERDEEISEESPVWMIGAICQQGWHMSPYSTSIKIIFFFGTFTGLISFIAYSAALVSILSVEVVPIHTFQDLISENFYIASDNKIPTAKFLVNYLEDTNKIPKLEDGVRNVEMTEYFDKLIKTRLAIVTIPDSFYPVIQQKYTDDFICSTISVKVVSSRPLKSSCIVRRGSPLREFFNYKLLLMQERGVKDRLIKHYILGTSVQCLESTGSFQVQLGLRDLFTAFAIFAAGFFLSLFIVILEKLINIRIKKQFANC